MSDLPNIGEVVRFTTRTARYGALMHETRVGCVRCVWSQDGNDAIIDTDAGTIHPGLGDTWERLAGAPEPKE